MSIINVHILYIDDTLIYTYMNFLDFLRKIYNCREILIVRFSGDNDP